MVFVDDLMSVTDQKYSSCSSVLMIRLAEQHNLIQHLDYAYSCWKSSGHIKPHWIITLAEAIGCPEAANCENELIITLSQMTETMNTPPAACPLLGKLISKMLTTPAEFTIGSGIRLLELAVHIDKHMPITLARELLDSMWESLSANLFPPDNIPFLLAAIEDLDSIVNAQNKTRKEELVEKWSLLVKKCDDFVTHKLSTPNRHIEVHSSSAASDSGEGERISLIRISLIIG
jgi:hypothetical protein